MIQSAFLLGFLGSLHCIAMCGPIAVVVHTSNYKKGLLNSVVYSFGRVITYSILGLLFYNIGFLSSLVGYQNILSITLGSIILILLALNYYKKFNRGNKKLTQVQNKISSTIRKPFQRYIKKTGILPKFTLGLLNGLLPCGLVYIALAVSTTQSNYSMAMFYMLLFGLGTIPAMILIAQFGSFLQQKRRLNFGKIVPTTSLVIAALLIVRGLALGIPYLSPDIKIINNKPISSCCHQDDHCKQP